MISYTVSFTEEAKQMKIKFDSPPSKDATEKEVAVATEWMKHQERIFKRVLEIVGGTIEQGNSGN
jgi:hypothetical protein